MTLSMLELIIAGTAGAATAAFLSFLVKRVLRKRAALRKQQAKTEAAPAPEPEVTWEGISAKLRRNEPLTKKEINATVLAVYCGDLL